MVENMAEIRGHTALIAAGAAGLGFAADRAVQLPSLTSNTTLDGLIDVAIGIGIAVLGMHMDHGEIGPAVMGFGAGWAVSAGLSVAGIA